MCVVVVVGGYRVLMWTEELLNAASIGKIQPCPHMASVSDRDTVCMGPKFPATPTRSRSPRRITPPFNVDRLKLLQVEAQRAPGRTRGSRVSIWSCCSDGKNGWRAR